MRCHSLRDLIFFNIFFQNVSTHGKTNTFYLVLTRRPRSALKLYFHCPWVLFIDSLSVLPASPGFDVPRLASRPLLLQGWGIFCRARWSFFFLFYISLTAYVGFCLSQLLPSSNANKRRQERKKTKIWTGGDSRGKKPLNICWWNNLYVVKREIQPIFSFTISPALFKPRLYMLLSINMREMRV